MLLNPNMESDSSSSSLSIEKTLYLSILRETILLDILFLVRNIAWRTYICDLSRMQIVAFMWNETLTAHPSFDFVPKFKQYAVSGSS